MIKLPVIELPSWFPHGLSWTRNQFVLFLFVCCLLDCFPLVHLPPDHGLADLCLWPKSIYFGQNYFLQNLTFSYWCFACNLVSINIVHRVRNRFYTQFGGAVQILVGLVCQKILFFLKKCNQLLKLFSIVWLLIGLVWLLLPFLAIKTFFNVQGGNFAPQAIIKDSKDNLHNQNWS